MKMVFLRGALRILCALFYQSRKTLEPPNTPKTPKNAKAVSFASPAAAQHLVFFRCVRRLRWFQCFAAIEWQESRL